MNYEDTFIPTQGDEHFYMETDAIQKQKNIMDELKLSNPRFHKIYKKVYTKLGKRLIPIEFYSSGARGNLITHAISGSRQKGHVVGSINEDLFFKASFCSSKVSNEHVTLFYYSPEDYESHQCITLSDSIKDKWKDKFIKTSLKLKLNE